MVQIEPFAEESTGLLLMLVSSEVSPPQSQNGPLIIDFVVSNAIF